MSLDALGTDLLTDLWIGGKAVPAGDGGRFDVLDPSTGKVLSAARAGRAVVVAADRVATTKPATTSTLVANLYFIHSSLSACASSAYGHGPPARLKTSNARACTAALGRHVTGCEGRTALPPSRPIQGRPTRSR